MIDKAIFYLPISIPTRRIQETAEQNGITVVRGRARSESKSWLLQVLPVEQGFSFQLGKYRDSTSVNSVISKPSYFNTFLEYWISLRWLLSVNELFHARLVRVDFAVDFDIPFDELLRGFYVAAKRNKSAYEDRGRKHTGFYVGSRPEKYVLYDKEEEQKRKRKFQYAEYVGPKTRLEVQLTDKKIPVNYLRELPSLLADETRPVPFEHIGFYDVSIREISAVTGRTELIRITELNTLVQHIGYLRAINCLNRHGNFSRDYKPLVTAVLREPGPVDMFIESIQQFFTGWADEFITLQTCPFTGREFYTENYGENQL